MSSYLAQDTNLQIQACDWPKEETPLQIHATIHNRQLLKTKGKSQKKWERNNTLPKEERLWKLHHISHKKKSKRKQHIIKCYWGGGENCQPRIPYLTKLSFRNESKSRQSQSKRIWCQQFYSKRMSIEYFLNRNKTMK